jgi:hypothetical protein
MMNSEKKNLIFLPKSLLVISLASQFVSCGSPTNSSSDILVSSVQHTAAKRQSIGNCWIYAQATWLESLTLSNTGEKLNVSESYWTYWHWYNDLVNSSMTEIQPGGTWTESSQIVVAHGWLEEKDFIYDEAGEEMSNRQKSALEHMNTQLKTGGRLATRASRTPKNIRAELDKAFGVVMADAQKKARKASETFVGKRSDNTKISLVDALRGGVNDRWELVDFPQIYGKNTRATPSQEASRKKILRRVMKALNDRKPVVMSLMIDFNALDITDQTFKEAKIKVNGGSGRQGGHMLVLHDYAVKDVPGVGVIPEGDQPNDMKLKALEGQITMLKAKNSWGTNRPDRGLTDGFTRFEANYLMNQLEWKNEASTSSTFYTTLSEFVLPPGY